MNKTALLSGISGQDGSFLAELLLNKNYNVHGIIRRSSSFNTKRIDHLIDNPNFHLHFGDLTDSSSIDQIITKVQPDEIYNLGCMSHVRVSFDVPVYTTDSIAMGTIRLLESIRQHLDLKKVRFYQASSSEQFGSSPPPQNENTPFRPRSPYACGKVYAHYQIINYREAYGLFACCGILFNHESERRGETFVTRKITRAATRIKLGLQKSLILGNLDAKRDWGYAPDYCKAMHLMLQQDQPDDYVISTGEMHTVREFVQEVFLYLGITDWERYIAISDKYFRPTEVDALCGDSSKAKNKLKWSPTTGFKGLVHLMVDNDLILAKQERAIKDMK